MDTHKGMHSGKLVSAVFIAWLCLNGLCSADDYFSPGTYFILGGLTGFEDFQNTGVEKFNDAWGIELRVGYRFNKYLAAEGDLNMLTGFDATVDLSKVNPSLSGTDKVVLDITNLTANLKAHWPLGRFDPYALAGAGIMYSRVRTTYQTGYY
jgi:opacity protein-like surface antigen